MLAGCTGSQGGRNTFVGEGTSLDEAKEARAAAHSCGRGRLPIDGEVASPEMADD